MNPSAIANVGWLMINYGTPTAFFGTQSHFKPMQVYDLNAKTNTWTLNMSTLHERLYNKFEAYVFHIFTGFDFAMYWILTFTELHLDHIHVVLTMLWPFQKAPSSSIS